MIVRTVSFATLLLACHRSALPEATPTDAKQAEPTAPEAKPAEVEPPVADVPSDVLRSGLARNGRIEVQIVDLTADEEKAIDAVLAAGGDIAPGDPRMPSRWRVGRPFTVWLGHEARTAKVLGYESGSGGSGTIYTMLLEANGLTDKGVWVTDVGGPKPADAKGAGLDAAAAKRAMPALRTMKAKFKLAGKLAAKDVAAMRGAFPAPHTTAVTVNIEVGGGDPTAGVTSGLLLTDDAGNVTAEPFELSERLDRFEMSELIDLGDDGTDELVFTTTYYEGNYTHLLRWNGATPETVVIEGDGA